jgi:cytochrome b561
MAARSEHFPYFWRSVWTRRGCRLASYGGAALVVVTVGELGLLSTSSVRRLAEFWININVLFGVLLSCFVLACYRRRMNQAPPVLPADVRELSRHLSRIVYLLLYLVIGVRQVIGILDPLWNFGMSDPGLLDGPFPDITAKKTSDTLDLQMFFASGLCVLVMARVLAFRVWVRLRDHA